MMAYYIMLIHDHHQIAFHLINFDSRLLTLSQQLLCFQWQKREQGKGALS
jgi:hypothetical protein